MVVLAAALAATGCGGGGGRGDDNAAVSGSAAEPSPSTTVNPASKVSGPLEQAVGAIEAARTRGRTDLAGLSTPFVHIRADGAIEVAIHARAVVTADQLAALRRLGAEVGASTVTPSLPGVPAASVVQAWVPYDRLAALAALDWVATVAAPSYGQTGG